MGAEERGPGVWVPDRPPCARLCALTEGRLPFIRRARGREAHTKGMAFVSGAGGKPREAEKALLPPAPPPVGHRRSTRLHVRCREFITAHQWNKVV